MHLNDLNGREGSPVTKIPAKHLALLCLLLAVCAMIPAGAGSWWVLVPVAGSLGCAWLSEETTHLRRQGLIAAGVLGASAIAIAVVRHGELADQRRFERYLTAHRCVLSGVVVMAYGAGVGGRYREDEEPGESEEPQYKCRGNGERLTFSEFISRRLGE